MSTGPAADRERFQGEFALIDAFVAAFVAAGGTTRGNAVRMGPGDDAALLDIPLGESLVVTTDTALPGVHFLAATPPSIVGYRALAINLSDLAAMGATSLAFVIALTVPDADHKWLTRFSTGLAKLAAETGTKLIGGNFSRGALSITITALGSVPPAQALMRRGAQVGDDIYVSGHIGSGAQGLRLARSHDLAGIDFGNLGDREAPLARYLAPRPRLALGQALRGIATACIDVSDGLLQDLSHLLNASTAGAALDSAALPLADGCDLASALGASDDYELVFTAPDARQSDLGEIGRRLSLRITRIGRVTAAGTLTVDGKQVHSTIGFDHFSRQP